ncbi:MAG: DUF4190 domain-containing protein [Promicromonosporaceae bacterium]|nr:DUF4190 domain-containing protein [Promicromonosporaceae bacterium]
MSNPFDAPDPSARVAPPAPAPQYGAPAAPQYGAPQAPQYGAPQAPQYQPAQQGAWQQGYVQEDPGKTLGIVALVFAFFFSLVGLILGIIAGQKSRAAGFKNTLATVAIWVSAVWMVLTVILLVAVGIDGVDFSF